jgi:hypothetical protein
MKTVGRWRFHHLVVESRCSLAHDPSARLFAALPTAPMEAPVDLRIEVRAGSAAELEARLAGPPIMTDGEFEVRASAGSMEGTGPQARVTVDAGPVPRLDAVVDRAAAEDPGALHRAASRPTLLAFAGAARARGLFLLGATGVVLPGDRAVLLVGPPGGGTATLARALVATGAEPFGETIWLSRRDGQVQLFALAAERSPTEPGQAGPARTEAGAPMAILLPATTGALTTRLEPADPADALGALLAALPLPALPGLAGAASPLPILGELVERVVVHRVALGRDLLADGVAVARLVAGRLADA